jgi:hypothetical protein
MSGRTPDGKVWANYHDPNTGWPSWGFTVIPGSGVGGDPVTTFDGKDIWVFAYGSDGDLYTAFHDPTQGWPYGFTVVS